MASFSRIVVPVVTFVAAAGLQVLYALVVDRRTTREAAQFADGTFDYRRFDWSWLRVPLVLPLLASGVWALVRMSRSFSEVGVFLSALMCVFIILFCLVFGGGVVPTLIQIADTRRRRRQRVRADASGLTYDTGGQQVTTRWDQISDYYITPLGGRMTFPSRYVVVTTEGIIRLHHQPSRPPSPGQAHRATRHPRRRHTLGGARRKTNASRAATPSTITVFHLYQHS